MNSAHREAVAYRITALLMAVCLGGAVLVGCGRRSAEPTVPAPARPSPAPPVKDVHYAPIAPGDAVRGVAPEEYRQTGFSGYYERVETSVEPRVEPYTLPLAAVLAVAALVAERRGPSEQVAPGTWVTWGPSLLVAAVPTVWMSLLDPHGFRPLVALVAAMVVLTGGAFSGRRAWVDVGAASVMVLGLARLVPVLADAPNWLTIGLTGAALVAVGATFEQRRRDVRGVRDRYSALR